jgi:hypothetical protein
VQPLVVVRPPALRAVALATLAVIVTWAALSGDLGGIGVIAYPAIVALQAAREVGWRLEVGSTGVRERQGVGGTRDIPWSRITAVLMPDSAWWRVNPVLQVDGGPNVQLTAGEGAVEVVAVARRRGVEVVGSPGSIALVRSLGPWVLLLGLACLLLGLRLAGGG